MPIIKPIVIVGTGRCGSTMLHRLLAQHDHVAWLSTFNEVFPTYPSLSVFSNLYRARWLGQKIRHLSSFPKPFEAYRFWEHYLPGFSRRHKPLTAEDVPDEGIAAVRQTVEKILKYQRKRRFLVKVTGWSRIAYFNRIFPDALFVFLNREHRSVVSSWVQAGWLDVTSGIDEPTWQWGTVPDSYQQIWEELGAGPLLSAAVKIQLDLDDIERNMAQFPERTYKLQYESLITHPLETLGPLLNFLQLDWTPKFDAVIQGKSFYNPINKWRKYLSEEEGKLIVEFFERANERKEIAANA
jgi:hypothetical protein